jgi:hypothetical protein
MEADKISSQSDSGKLPAVSESSNPSPGAIISLSRWLGQVGVTACTAWRWRKKGWLKTVNIAGRQYLTQESIREFTLRAKRGEFAQASVVPKRALIISGS